MLTTSSGPSRPPLSLLRGVRRGVLRRRRLLAALAAAVAVAAGLQAVATPPEPTVPVAVAARDLPVGTRLTSTDLIEVGFAEGSVPGDLAERPEGRVLAAPVRRGEPLSDVRLVGPRLNEGRPDLVVLPVRLPDPGMAALLEPGDLIDLMATDPQEGTASMVARAVEVLALPPVDEGGLAASASGSAGRLVVLGVDPVEASAIAAASVRDYVTFTWSDR